MLQRDPIYFHRKPLIWIKDKYKAGINQKDAYIIASIPGIFVILGFIANITSLIQVNPQKLTILLIWLLFGYGLLNLIFITVIQRTGIRMKRDRRTFEIIHRDIAERLRDYFTEKRQIISSGKSIDEQMIVKHIERILNKVNDNYMKTVHRNKVSVSLKYLKKNKLFPIRIGNDAADRNPNPEHLKESYVYQILTRDGRKINYLYVKDINNPDKHECSALGEYKDELQTRAKTKYNTFIALPIRAGKMKTKSDFTTRADLGILGFDLKEKYGFGNFDEHEFHIMGCLVDLLSEPVQDLIAIK